MALFPPALEIVLAHEGGYVPQDAGTAGAVNFGITQKYILATERAQTWEDAGEIVRLLRVSGAEVIYEEDYWKPYDLGKIDSQRFANILFSTMINMGTGTAAKNLQKALGIRINADGKFGPLTLAALNSTPPAEVEKKWKQRLINYYTQIAPRVGPQYLKGWLARVEDLFGPAGT